MSYRFSEDWDKEDLEALPDFLNGFYGALQSYIEEPEEWAEFEEYNEEWLTLFKSTVAQCKKIIDDMQNYIDNLQSYED